MKRVLALLCVFVFIAAGALSEGVATPTDITAGTPLENQSPEEVHEEGTSESVEEAPTPTDTLSSESTPPPVEIMEADTVEDDSSEVTSDLIEFEEDDWGEVTIAFKREVYISFLREPKYIGDTVTLVASLINFKDDDHYTISWQYSEDGQEWISIEGEDERTYTFILDKVNCHYLYRVLIIIQEEE